VTKVLEHLVTQVRTSDRACLVCPMRGAVLPSWAITLFRECDVRVIRDTRNHVRSVSAGQSAVRARFVGILNHVRSAVIVVGIT